MKNTLYACLAKFLILPAVMMTALTGCDPTRESGDRPVKFTARSNGSSATKTFYKDGPGGSGKVRISWNESDKIKIFSPSGGSVQGATTEAVHPTDPAYKLGLHYAVYGLREIDNGAAGAQSTARLVLAGENPNGLTWAGSGDATFYAVYPHTTPYNAAGQGLSFVLTMPSAQSGDASGVASMPLVARTPDVESGKAVNLAFNPAFSAFEIHLRSAAGSGDIDLHSFTLSQDNTGRADSEKKYVTGTCYYNMEGAGIHYVTGTPAVSGEQACSESVTVNLSGQSITETREVVFTLFTLPDELDRVSVTVNFTKDGRTKSRTLKLKRNNAWIRFPACHKARISGLALDGGASWELTVEGEVLPWDGYSQSLDHHVSIQEKVSVSGAIENTTAWQSTVGGGSSSHYAEAGGYSKYHQIRTLNRDLPENRRHFTVTFTPTAPTGGYWMLVPTFRAGDTESPKHFRFEVVLPGGDVSSQLRGPILNSAVTIRIYPKDYVLSDINTYDVWFRTFFSPSRNFSPSINADSEFQDAHSDGRFSYWTFRLAHYEGYYTED